MLANEDMARVESEAGIIATLIHHPDFSYYSEQLLPNHFTNEENRYIYQAICSLARDGIERIDPYNIIQALTAKEATRRFADELSIDQLYTLMENSENISRNTVEEYKLLVNNVMDAAFRRDTYQQLKECQKLCTQPSAENIEQKIYKMLDDVMMEFSTTNDVPAYKDVVDKCWEEIKGRQGAGYAGIPFKFPALNDYATIERGELFIFGAEQKQGKSMMLLNCAVDLLKQDSHMCLNDPKYVTKDENNIVQMTDYGRLHIDECCLVFKLKVKATNKYGEEFYKECVLFRDVDSGIVFQTTFAKEVSADVMGKADAILAREMEIQRVLQELPAQFGAALVYLMEWVEISEETLAEKALISSKLVQRLRNNPAYPKNVDCVVAVCIGMNLPPELSNALISRSGFTLRLAQSEAHLMYNFFLNHLYMSSIHECNDMLVAKNLPVMTGTE